jgi:hypothetical protein
MSRRRGSQLFPLLGDGGIDIALALAGLGFDDPCICQQINAGAKTHPGQKHTYEHDNKFITYQPLNHPGQPGHQLACTHPHSLQ